VNILAV